MDNNNPRDYLDNAVDINNALDCLDNAVDTNYTCDYLDNSGSFNNPWDSLDNSVYNTTPQDCLDIAVDIINIPGWSDNVEYIKKIPRTAWIMQWILIMRILHGNLAGENGGGWTKINLLE